MLYIDSWFRSQHEDIDLISEDDFYLNAPESVSRPVSAWDLAATNIVNVLCLTGCD